MKIFKITFDNYTYDEYDSFIVRAKDREDAIKLLEELYPKDYEFSGCPWYSEFEVEEVSLEGEREKLLGSFHAG